MKILYQPAQSSPSDWLETTAALWPGLGEMNINAVCVQGLTFEGPDHYAVEDLPGGGVRVVVWHDDPDDWPPGSRWAREVCFFPLAPDTDPRFGGAVNTCQIQVLYAEGAIKQLFESLHQTNPKVSIKSWEDFDTNRAASRDGIWLSDASYQAHQASREVKGWREWCDHLDSSELDSNGCLCDQRSQNRYEIPKGTRTYYHIPVDGGGVNGASIDNSLALGPTTQTNQGSGNVGTVGKTMFEAISPADEPDSAAWPATGVYRCQLDIVAAGADLAFGLLDMGSGDGGFERVDSTVSTELQRLQQDEAAFTGSGLHLATLTDPAWAAGTQSDRVGLLLAAQRVVGHGNQSFTLQTGELDDFLDGPWAAVASAGGQILFLGHIF